MTTFGDRLSNLRNKKKMSQDELAKVLKVGKSTLGMYETDKRKPDHEMLNKIADLFEVSIDYLLGRAEVEVIHRKEEEKLDPDKIIAEKLLTYLHQGLTNEEIRKRMDFILDVFTLEAKHADEFLDFVRNQLKKKELENLLRSKEQ